MDKREYLSYLRSYCIQFQLDILAYCLMTNHIHLIVKGHLPDSLEFAIGRTNGRYAQYFNKRYSRNGHLWQGRFFSEGIDEERLTAVICYIERNPARAEMVKNAWDFPWSSASAHIGGTDHSKLLDLSAWFTDRNAEDWRIVLGAD